MSSEAQKKIRHLSVVKSGEVSNGNEAVVSNDSHAAAILTDDAVISAHVDVNQNSELPDTALLDTAAKRSGKIIRAGSVQPEIQPFNHPVQHNHPVQYNQRVQNNPPGIQQTIQNAAYPGVASPQLMTPVMYGTPIMTTPVVMQNQFGQPQVVHLPMQMSASIPVAEVASATKSENVKETTPLKVTGQRSDAPRSNIPVIALILFAIIASLVIGERRGIINLGIWSDAAPLAVEDRKAFWTSGQPSLMRQVALEAIGTPNKTTAGTLAAQSLIIASVSEGKKLPQVRSELIRIAFDERWEGRLSASDRSLALTLGLADLVSEQLTSELPPLANAHPGVILAVASQLSISKPAAMLQNVAPERLAKLPSPFGLPFKALSKMGIPSMAAPEAIAMSQILTGQFSADNLLLLFRSQPEMVLAGLLPFLKANTYPAAVDLIFETVRHLPLDAGQRLQWFTKEKAAKWSDVARLSLIEISLGKIAKSLSLEQLADLLVFPLEKIRAQAAHALQQIPGNQFGKSLDLLTSPANSLSRLQTIYLVTALSLKNETSESFLSRWFSLEPDAQVVLQLLLTRTEQGENDAFNFEAARYLVNASLLEISDADLARLVRHPEPLARALAYAHSDPGKQSQADMVRKMLSQEKNGPLRERVLQKMKLSEDAVR
jgi:hypothetical protein